MTTATSSQEVKPGCQGKCVNVSVPYPSVFEKPDCSKKEHFFLDCSSNDGDAELWFGRNMPACDSIALGSGPFMFSNFRNMLTAIGCDTKVMETEAEVTVGCCLSLICTENINAPLIFQIAWQLTLIADGKHTSVVGIEIECVVKNERREQAKASTSAYTCGSNTGCTHSNNVQRYLACTVKFQRTPLSSTRMPR
ncbi:PREDICTED: uncharacterized protein LOC105119264 [Populus euphratica]|uniref:Uncharacterized protein LOC105119264 n=1 Tax=Populus euphratica TaxID=75702 RepID=A0AAJ6XE87_POPEU|nr:PREDICTED: uncharacterized protein LOC105119264 [Populus euphratica]